ncbi:MAG: hypothetical protein H6621_03480 [Halobacteriovoraceae bacterium]|nr:hypothetical protein [Halobacteriovoraceae bacterium]MCB9094109.1 hypothetical protein [Halobacteriovoraceae bacterium]
MKVLKSFFSLSIIASSLLFWSSCSNDSGKVSTTLGNSSDEVTREVVPNDGEQPVGGENSCTGTVDDGWDDSNGQNTIPLASLFIYQISMAGGYDAVPGQDPQENKVYTYIDDNGQTKEAFIAHRLPSYADSFYVFQNDGAYFIRLKVNEQFFPAKGKHHCYLRNINAGRSNYSYQKLRFGINARIVVKNLDGSITPYGIQHYIQTTDPIEVGKCSPIIKIPALPGPPGLDPSRYATVIELRDVRSDQWCQEGVDGETWCPAERQLREADCWDVTLEISTSNTHFFKGYKRSDFN